MEICLESDADLIGDYIAQGASSVVLSDAIFEKEAMDHRRFNLIHQLSQLAVLRVNEAVQRLEFELPVAYDFSVGVDYFSMTRLLLVTSIILLPYMYRNIKIRDAQMNPLRVKY